MNEHVKEKMLSHMTDFIKELGQWKLDQPGLQAPQSRSRRTRGGLEAQEQASEAVLPSYLVNLCLQQQTEMDRLIGLVNDLTSAVERLERRHDESRMRVETQLQELSIRLVRCYAIVH